MALQTTIQARRPNKGSLEAFAGKLLNKIIQADSPAAVERYIAVAMKALGNNKVNGYIIQRFIDRITVQLNSYNPATAQEILNRKIAGIKLIEFRQAIAQPAISQR